MESSSACASGSASASASAADDECARLKEVIENLRAKNDELAQDNQKLKVQFKESELQRITLIKENYELCTERNKYKHYARKLKNVTESLASAVSKELKDMKRVADDFEKMDNNCKTANDSDANFIEMSPSTKNVNHVRPMIRGYTIKNPFIVVSRNIGNFNQQSSARVEADAMNATEEVIEDASNVDIEPVRTERASRELELLNLCVSLRRIDVLQARNGLTKKESVSGNDSAASEGDQVYSVTDSPHIVSAPEETNEDDASAEYPQNSDASYEQQKELSIIIEATDELAEVTELTSNKSKASEIKNKSTSFVSPPSKRNSEDPLEGPSWLFETKENISTQEKSSKTNNFVSTRKKKKVEPIHQTPDSTSETLEGHSMDIEFPFHSTPNSQIKTRKPINFPNESDNISEETTKPDEVANLNRNENQSNTSKGTRKSSVKKDKKSSSSIDAREASPSISRRGRRLAEVRSYKEPSLNKKLRR